MDQLTLTLHKTPSSRVSTSTRMLWATFHPPRFRWSYPRRKPR